MRELAAGDGAEQREVVGVTDAQGAKAPAPLEDQFGYRWATKTGEADWSTPVTFTVK